MKTEEKTSYIPWYLIGDLALIGIGVLAGLMFLAPEPNEPVPMLAGYGCAGSEGEVIYAFNEDDFPYWCSSVQPVLVSH